MTMKAYNPMTGKLEDISAEEIEVLCALQDQFTKDAALLLAETEIVRSILKQHLSEADDEDVCTD